MGTPEGLKLLLVPGTTFPQAVHLFINLFCIESRQLLPQLLQCLFRSYV